METITPQFLQLAGHLLASNDLNRCLLLLDLSLLPDQRSKVFHLRNRYEQSRKTRALERMESQEHLDAIQEKIEDLLLHIQIAYSRTGTEQVRFNWLYNWYWEKYGNA